jgi:TatD DNase family protein
LKRWFDTHCHLDRYPETIVLKNLITQAQHAGVKNILIPGTCGAVANAGQFYELSGISMAWGVHPMYAGSLRAVDLEKMWEEKGYHPAAIGECGFDRRLDVPLERQQEIFCWQLELAGKTGLPIILHLVGHYQLAFDLAQKMQCMSQVVCHSWTGSPEMACRFIRAGAFVSLSAASLRNPEKLKRLFQLAGLNAIVLETDGPDQIPASLPLIGEAVAAIAEIEVAKFAEILYTNSLRIFAGSGSSS